MRILLGVSDMAFTSRKLTCLQARKLRLMQVNLK
jgi:hypothetical protein